MTISRPGGPIWRPVSPFAAVSVSLGTLAFCLAIGLGIPWGVLLAVRRGQWTDYAWGLLALLIGGAE